MTALADEILRLIAREGPLSVARYMRLCLTHPEHGYYCRQEPFGGHGDFITAPEITQMFGELLGLWCAAVWSDIGSPATITLVELGPGRGTLMADALRATRVLPRFRQAVRVHLVEASPRLRAAQEATLAGAGVPIAWHERFADVPAAGPLLVIANEFFDALPVRQFIGGEGGWHERLVGVRDGGGLCFRLDAAAVPTLPEVGSAAPPDTVAEVSPEGLALAFDLGARIAADDGAALILDYGDRGGPFGDTLQAVRRHRFTDPLDAPGEADLTAQVRFDALADAAGAAGAAATAPVPQGTFLDRLGLVQRAARLKAGATAGQASAIDAAVNRLTDTAPTGMGALFKAMAIARRGRHPPPGFS